jgi:hypothetical protein
MLWTLQISALKKLSFPFEWVTKKSEIVWKVFDQPDILFSNFSSSVNGTT